MNGLKLKIIRLSLPVSVCLEIVRCPALILEEKFLNFLTRTLFALKVESKFTFRSYSVFRRTFLIFVIINVIKKHENQCCGAVAGGAGP
jgi:hypothetical protein